MPNRLLLITADDFGIGPETTRGILDAALQGVVTSSVVLVTSPFVEDSLRIWDAKGRPVELGWHPCLTLDAPILPANRVPSLVGNDGRFHNLSQFLKRVLLGRINPAEVKAEFRAQLERYLELIGSPPANVNAHHHIHVFGVVLDSLLQVLSDFAPKPFLRRVVESFRTIRKVPGARLKRLFLADRGSSAAHRQDEAGFPGNDTLLGVTDPQHVSNPEFFNRWLASSSGELVELACHPGYHDSTLSGRDNDHLLRRPHELELLMKPEFQAAVKAAGFRLVTSTEMSDALSGNEPGFRRAVA